MPDSPPQAIHGLLSASPDRDAAPAIRCRCFFQQPKIKSRRGHDPDLRGFNRSDEGHAKLSRVLATGGRDKRAMDGARPSQDMDVLPRGKRLPRSEEHTSELQSLMSISYSGFCL